MPQLIAFALKEKIIVSGDPRDTHGPEPGEVLGRLTFPSNTKRRRRLDALKATVFAYASDTHRLAGCNHSGGGELWVRRAGFDDKDAIDLVREALTPVP